MEALVPRIDPLFAAGRAFYDMFRAGTIKADYEEAGKADGDQVPF
jgi:hypothetical protein